MKQVWLKIEFSQDCTSSERYSFTACTVFFFAGSYLGVCLEHLNNLLFCFMVNNWNKEEL